MRPLVPILISYAAGILGAEYLALPAYAVYALLALSIILPLLFYYFRRIYRPMHAMPLFFLLGIIAINARAGYEPPDGHIANFMRSKAGQTRTDANSSGSNEYEDLKGVVVTGPEEPGARSRLDIDATWISRGGVWQKTAGRVRLTVQGRIEARPGDTVRLLAKLYFPENFGNPGEYDYKSRLNLAGIFATGFVKNPDHIFVIKKSNNLIRARLAEARTAIRRFIDHNAKEHGILNSLVIADQGGVPVKTRENYAKTGTAHILSISGLHVAIVAGFFYAITQFLLKRSERVLLAVNAKKASTAIALIFIVLYGFLADFPVATQRSVVMALVFAAAFLIGRGYEIYNTMSLAALVILIWSPDSIWDISFQLTFAAVFSIIYMIPRLNTLFESATREAKVGRIELHSKAGLLFKKRILPMLLVTLCASIGTAPILAYHFHRIALSGLFANLIAVPLSGVITPLVLVAAITSFAQSGTAALLLYFADLLTQLMNEVIRFFAAIPFSAFWVSTPTMFETLLFYALIFCALNFRRHKYYIYAAVLLVFIGASNHAYNKISPVNSAALKVTYISVGQGESALIEFPDNKTMLVDGGGLYTYDFDVGQRIVAPFLWHKKIFKIDYMLLSHAQRDHMAGLRFIAENFDVGEFIWNGQGELGSLGQTLKNRGIPIRIVKAGDGINTSTGDITLNILNPPAEGAPNSNDGSIVFSIRHKGVSFLMTGDISGVGERRLLENFKRNPSSALTVLKAPHHGSRNSSGIEFIRAVSPAVVVISAGRGNVFGFPHAETLERYRAAGARIFRTDLDGAVTITSDGAEISAHAYKNH